MTTKYGSYRDFLTPEENELLASIGLEYNTKEKIVTGIFDERALTQFSLKSSEVEEKIARAGLAIVSTQYEATTDNKMRVKIQVLAS